MSVLSRAKQREIFSLALAIAMAGLLAAPNVHGQAVAVAGVDGRVSDATGAAVAEAHVRIIEIDTQQVHATVTDQQGHYTVPNLPVGNYTFEVAVSGFKTFSEPGVNLQVGQNIEINATMQVGAVSETIEVNAKPSMVETRDNSISEVIDTKRIVDLPLNGRNPAQLLTLTGAALPAPAGDLVSSKNIQGSNGSGAYSVAGGQANGVNYLLDGGDNNDAFSNVNLPLPFPDALQEFSVQTNALPAQFGLHPGAVVNAVTKSGTNAFHGTAFDFLRNGIFDARQENTPTRDTLKRNQFGGVLGGPILKNKLFFFGGYQGTRQRSNPPSSISYILNQNVLSTGNMSAYTALTALGGCLAAKTPQILKNPAGGAFAGNIIPVRLFNPAAVMLARNYLPQTSDPCGEVQYGVPANNPDDQWIGRVDYIRSDRHSVYFRYYLYDYTVQATFDGSNVLPTKNPGNAERSQTATFGDTYTFSPTVLNSFHATFDRRRDDRSGAPNLISPATLGINNRQLLTNGIDLEVNGYFQAGCGACALGYFNVNNYQVSDDFSIIRGKHQFGFGIDARREQLNNANNQQSQGQFSFNGNATGNALADFLLGDVDTYTQGNPNPNALRETVFAAYAQDNWRVTPRLILNLGVRWEPNLPPYDAQNRGNQFQVNAFTQNIHSAVNPSAPAGLFFAGDKQQNPNGASFSQNHWLSTSPRIGLVWDINGNGKQTIRSAFALMHDSAELFFPERLTTNPPYASSVTLNNVSLTNPWSTYPGGNPFPGAAIFPLAGTYVSIPPNMKPTYMMHWNFSYQRQITSNWLVTFNYIGNVTRHIWGAYDVNPAVYIPGQSSTKNTNARRVLSLANPAQGGYYSSIAQADDGGVASYNALLISAKHRFAQHYTFLSNYTWSHCVSDIDFQGELAGDLYQNQNNRAGEKGSCIFDERSIFNTSIVAASSGLGHGFAHALTTDWQFSAILTAYTGQPINIVDGTDVSLTGGGHDRPNQILTNPLPSHQTVAEFLNPAAFQAQPAGTFGNVGRDSVTGPGSWNLDSALSRSFAITERFHLEARADFFNALNHANWLAPSGTITSSTFGKITNFSSPRIIQLGMKLNF